MITIALLALLVAGLGAYIVHGQLTQKAAASSEGQLVQAPGQSNSGAMVQAPGNSGSGAPVQAPADNPPGKMVQTPGETVNVADIDDYLTFLKQIEASKQQLIRRQMSDELVLLTQVKALSATIDENDYNSTFNNANKSMNSNAQEWEQLTTTFNKRVPPPACVDLRNKYYDHLGKIQAAIFKVNSALSQVQSSPSTALRELTDMQGKASADVDSAIQSADDALYDVCKQYNLRKEFDIKGDSGSSALLR
jgi:hypothetical protein